MTTNEQPTETSRIVVTTGVNDEDRARGEQVDVTGWSDGSVGIGVEYTEEQTRTSTYAEGDKAREIGYAILAAVRPSNDARIEHVTVPGGSEYDTMIESATIENRAYLTGLAPDSDDARRYRVVEEDRDAIGTVYLDPTDGTMYRLRGWSNGVGSARGVWSPSYSTFLPGGASSMARALPEGVVPIWSPAAIPGTVR